MNQSITVKHNVEMAHRLFETPGKCQQIHGHSFGVSLTLGGTVSPSGLLAGLDFGLVKQIFRKHLDFTYDHRVLLNERDPWAGKLHWKDDTENGWMRLPGLQTLSHDPTTENFARDLGEWAVRRFGDRGITQLLVTVSETAVNEADWIWFADDKQVETIDSGHGFEIEVAT